MMQNNRSLSLDQMRMLYKRYKNYESQSHISVFFDKNMESGFRFSDNDYILEYLNSDKSLEELIIEKEGEFAKFKEINVRYDIERVLEPAIKKAVECLADDDYRSRDVLMESYFLSTIIDSKYSKLIQSLEKRNIYFIGDLFENIRSKKIYNYLSIIKNETKIKMPLKIIFKSIFKFYDESELAKNFKRCNYTVEMPDDMADIYECEIYYNSAFIQITEARHGLFQKEYYVLNVEYFGAKEEYFAHYLADDSLMIEKRNNKENDTVEISLIIDQSSLEEDIKKCVERYKKSHNYI